MVFLLGACSTSKVITNGKTEAVAFEKANDYKQATNAWLKFFNETSIEEIEGIDFASAAKTALKAGDTATAKGWFDQARYKNYADSSMYLSIANVYKAEGNMDKELSSLEFYCENYGVGNDYVNSRMFAIYSEFAIYDKAETAWKNMTDKSKQELNNVEKYFKVNKKLKNKTVCDSLANVLLNLEPDNKNALEWNAKKYYWAGQNRYTKEMAKYNKNKTRKAYKLLLAQLDIVTADFKKALPYLNKLWKEERTKDYAQYLANIYARFGDDKKATYYKGFMK